MASSSGPRAKNCKTFSELKSVSPTLEDGMYTLFRLGGMVSFQQPTVKPKMINTGQEFGNSLVDPNTLSMVLVNNQLLPYHPHMLATEVKLVLMKN